jgi:23S rRNA pseudouridine2605 synthase
MPPRHAYWTIILEGKPTAFRAHTEEELLPTLKQLQARHPDTVLRWFSRGRLWHSKEEEQLAQAARKVARENRGREWRPGGTHRDPRERFKIPRDEKRQRFRDRLFRDRQEQGKPGRTGSDAPRPPRTEDRRPQGDRPPRAGVRPPRSGDRAGKPGRPPKPDGARGWTRGAPPRGRRGGGKPGGGRGGGRGGGGGGPAR